MRLGTSSLSVTRAGAKRSRKAVGETYPRGPAWNDIGDASYGYHSSTLTDSLNKNSIFFSPDGYTAFITTGGSSNTTAGRIKQVSLLSPYHITSGYTLEHTFYPPVQGSYSYLAPYDLFFKSDGTILFYTDWQSDKVCKHTLSTAWDLSTVSTNPVQTFQVSPEYWLRGLYFSSDGTKMFTLGFSQNRIMRHDLSTAWDLSTASVTHTSNFIGGTSLSLWFKPDGYSVFVCNNYDDVLRQWDLATAWDVSGMTHTNYSSQLDTSSIDNLGGLWIHDVGTLIFMGESNTNKFHRYTNY